MRTLVMTLILILTACTESDSDDAPDDGAVDAPDTPDAPPATDGPAACTVTDPRTCVGNNICLNSTCAPAFPRPYVFAVTVAAIPTTNAENGQPWDVGNAPDPYAEVSLNRQLILTTGVQTDTFAPAWTDTTTVVIPDDTGSPDLNVLSVIVWDADPGDDDGVLACRWTHLTADLVHPGSVTCTGELGSVTIAIRPVL